MFRMAVDEGRSVTAHGSDPELALASEVKHRAHQATRSALAAQRRIGLDVRQDQHARLDPEIGVHQVSIFASFEATQNSIFSEWGHGIRFANHRLPERKRNRPDRRFDRAC